MIKGVLIDYGATLDTNGIHWAEVMWDEYCKHKIQVTKEQFREAYIFGERTLAKEPLIKPAHHFGDLLSIKCDLQASYLFEKKYLSTCNWSQQIAASCYQFAKEKSSYAAETLSFLSKKYPLVLVSNFYGNLATVLADFGLIHFFNTIVESAVVGVRKPDPAIFRLGAEALQLSPDECVVVGDSLSKDILPAKSIGCKTIWLKGKSWDDADSMFDTAKEQVLVIEDFKDIIKIL